MKLFLASEAKHPDSLSKLDTFVGGFKNKTIAYIPTASNGELPYEDWKLNSTTWKLVNTLGANITAVQLEDYKDSKVLQELEHKDILWFAGGASGYLMYWIRRCQLDTYIPKLLKEGSIYVGSSAGSMITAPNLHVSEWYIGEHEVGSSIIPGLSLVDFEIYPHYEDNLLPEIKKHWKGNKLYLLKNGEAITVEDSHITVLGETRTLQ